MTTTQRLKPSLARSARLSKRDDRPVFQLESVGKGFGDLTALENLTFDVRPGERLALVGPSGAGKSTLINLLNGSLGPTEGSLTLLGRRHAEMGSGDLRRVQRRIGTIYQQFHLVPNLRVLHNVNAGHLGDWPLSKAAISLLWPQEVGRAKKALDRVGILEKLHARTSDLSGGQQQRVAIARVLLQDPEVILADEPIASLDPSHSRAIMDLLRDLSVETGTTLVVSLHSVEYAFSHCQRMIGLRAGRIVFDAVPGEVTPAMVDALYRIGDRA